MKKLLTDENLQKKLLFVFLIIQPILDFYLLYSEKVVSIFHFSPTTLIRLFFIAFLGIVVFFSDKNKRNKKLLLIYGFLVLLYTIVHHLYTSSLLIQNYNTFYYTLFTELFYVLRMLLPIAIIYLTYVIKFKKDEFLKVINITAFLISLIIVISNVFKLSAPSYGSGFIQGNIFDWFINKGKYSSNLLASRGWFYSANQISGLMMLLFPIVVYSLFEKANKFKIMTVILFILSMIMVGTRTASYGWILVILMIFIIDLFLVIIKKRNFNLKVYLLMAIILCVGTYISLNYAPVVSYEMIETYNKQDDEANQKILKLYESYKLLKTGDLSEEERCEIIDSSDCFEETGEIETDCFVELLAIDPQYYDRIYPVKEHMEFWNYFMFEVPQELKYGQRNIQLLILNDVVKEQKFNFTSLLGYGYSRFINAYLYLEHDFHMHYYTIGVLGIILFLIGYLVIAIYSLIKTFIKKEFDFLTIVLAGTIIEVLLLSYITGHIMDELIVTLFLGFITGYLLKRSLEKKVKNEEEKDVNEVKINLVENKKRKNKKDITVSVIVPCYNVENYLEKGIKSLCEQSLEMMEIIAIDDGSKDNTLILLDDLAKCYDNLVVIHKENEGVSKARNVGLDIAKGEYIAFMDSDDWVKSDCFIKLYNKAKENDYDIVACDTTAIYPDYEKIIKSNINDNEESQNLMIDAYAVIWNKIYKKSIIGNIRFKEGMNFCEDVLFLYMVYSKVSKVGVVDEALHYYLQRTGSLSYTYDSKLYQLIECMDEVINYYKKQKKFNEYKDEIEYSYVRYLYATFIKRLAKTKNKEEFKKGISYVKDKVNENFPNYKKNKYLNSKKGLYLKNFNSLLAWIVFLVEKNKMN